MCLIPRRGHRRARPVAARLHQVGRRRVRPARARRRLPDGVAAGRGRLARAVARQERRPRLAGLLPRAQPARSRPCCTRRTSAAAASSRESMEVQIQHLLSMQYSTAALRILALEDLLEGPTALHDQILGKNARTAGPGRYVRRRPVGAGRRGVPGGTAAQAAWSRRRARPPRNSSNCGEGRFRSAAAGLPAGRHANARHARASGRDLVGAVERRRRAGVLRRRHDHGVVPAPTERVPLPAGPQRGAARPAAAGVAPARRNYRAALPDITSPQTWRKTFDAP